MKRTVLSVLIYILCLIISSSFFFPFFAQGQENQNSEDAGGFVQGYDLLFWTYQYCQYEHSEDICFHPVVFYKQVSESGLGFEDTCAKCHITSAPYPYSLKTVGGEIVSFDGGTISVTDTSSGILGAQVEIPADALSEDTIIVISELVEEIPPLPENVVGIGSPVHFGPEGLVFNKPVTIKLPYTEEDLENAGVSDPQELDVYTFNTTTSTWELVEDPKIVDEENMLVMIDVTHFSIFQLGVKKVAIQSDLDGDGDIDLDDLNILLTYRNQPASACPECDIDSDGIITVLDARKLVLLCTRPGCATE